MGRIILGIDPGFVAAGFSVLSAKDRSLVSLHLCGALRMRSSDSLPLRIARFYDFFSKLIVEHSVTHLALETPFLGKNAQNFLKLGYLRGILMLIVAQHNLVLSEFSPREVKAALTGFGGASKEQVARVVMRLFPKLVSIERFDISDAVAISLCGLWINKVG
ncbi:MAG: crossover junction endodeoxyribonuclease RuvC [Candidatus Babeliaceae bacterium]|nr:crossover junction endodeoxyribonuclease RuvC [Candidatus Babeliaceae bacterium]